MKKRDSKIETDPYLEKLKQQYIKAKKAYYNKKKPIITDAAFDRLEDQIRKMDPDWDELKKTGVPVANKKTEVRLDEYAPSLNKAYPPAFPKWLAKNPAKSYIKMAKLDGTSLLLTLKKGVPTKLATRGNGEMGKDISFLIPALDLPVLKSRASLVLRIEAVMSKQKYKKWADKFEDPRSMVNGLFNRREPGPALADVDLVVLGVYGIPLTEAFAMTNLFKGQLRMVPNVMIRSSGMTTEAMTADLAELRKNGTYEVDGLVIAPNDFVLKYSSNDKPKNIVAFKVNADIDAVQVTVEKIIWKVSRTGRIIPKIRIADTVIGGVTVNHATSHNATWMVDRKIGPGAVLKVVRSGGVIPKIVDVIKPAKKLTLPDIAYNRVGVHFEVAQNHADVQTKDQIKLEQLVKFMTTMGIEFLASKTLTKLQPDLPTPGAYLRAWHRGRLGAVMLTHGIGAAMRKKIVAEFDRVFGSTVSMRQLMVASQCFGVGIGDRRLQQLEDAGVSMSWLSFSDEDEIVAKVSKIAGWSDKTVTLLVSGLPKWQKFHDSVSSMLTIYGSLPKRKKPSVNEGPLKGQRISFTGYRDKQQEAAIETAGGEVVPFGSKTKILLVKAGGKASSKVDKAKEKGIKVCSFEDLKL